MKLEAFGALSNFEFNIFDVVMRNEMHWFLDEKEKLFEKIQVSVIAADMAAQCLSLVCRFVITFRDQDLLSGKTSKNVCDQLVGWTHHVRCDIAVLKLFLFERLAVHVHD